ncbi:MAG: glycosyltransferase [Eubacteriales bacterium]|nr:glycosyltransferase [Eubacteriales bacterium]
MIDNIMVSIICNAYNHEDYIRDALDGFIMQKTDFPFEVLVHDDASTDNTAAIIKEYEVKYPDIIKPIYQTENQYSKDNSIVGQLQRRRAKGKYIAICEGDDYWTDSSKLQRQYCAMESHPEIDICAHKACRINASTNEICGYIEPSAKDCVLPVEEVIKGGGGFVATNSLFYRASINEYIPQFRQMLTLDYTLQLYASLRGGMLYINDCMSNYRVLAKGSWSSRMWGDQKNYRIFNQKIEDMLKVMDSETNYKYTDTIDYTINKNWVDLYFRYQDWDNLKKEPYRSFIRKLPLERRLTIGIKMNAPILSKVLISIKNCFIRK